MIHFTLKCANDHRFDSWFQSSVAFEKLLTAGMVTCAVCGSDQVEKAIMAPRIHDSRGRATEPTKDVPEAPSKTPLSAPRSPAEQAIAELRKRRGICIQATPPNAPFMARRAPKTLPS